MSKFLDGEAVAQLSQALGLAEPNQRQRITRRNPMLKKQPKQAKKHRKMRVDIEFHIQDFRKCYTLATTYKTKTMP